MSLFKKKAKESITLPEKFRGDFVYSPHDWLLRIKLNTKIVVPQRWWCIFVAKDKPCDILEAGEYVLDTACVPRLSKLLKLNKPIKREQKGKTEKVYRQEFDAFVYFINQKALAQVEWETGEIFLKKESVAPDEKKRFDVVLGGCADIACVDPSEMMRFYLYEWARVDNERARARIEEFLSEIVQETVSKIKKISVQEVDDVVNFAGVILPSLKKEFAEYGMNIENFVISRAIFDKITAAALRQEKLESNIASDEINELGAEISVVDDKAVTESKRGRKAGVVEVREGEVLDMTQDENIILNAPEMGCDVVNGGALEASLGQSILSNEAAVDIKTSDPSNTDTQDVSQSGVADNEVSSAADDSNATANRENDVAIASDASARETDAAPVDEWDAVTAGAADVELPKVVLSDSTADK